jgi:hypothetical protein
MEKLLKIKITIETEIIGENVYNSSDLKGVGRELFRANQDEIINQAIGSGEIAIEAEEITELSKLPPGWTPDSLPWAFAVFGSKKQERKIREFYN